MSRTIKFRAWDSDRKKMIYDFHYNLVEVSQKTYCFVPNEEKEILCGNYMDNGDWQEPILMQYTGLKDKNGKGEEIYESDLITNPSRNSGKPHPIIWSEKYGGWCGDYGIHYLIAPELIEILKAGNIYENPDLLT